MSTLSRVILCLEVRESYLYLNFYVVISWAFFVHQIFLANTNNLQAVVWFQVFLSNTKNLFTII